MANPSRTGDTATTIAEQTGSTPTPEGITELTALPRSERRDALEALVVREVRTALLMTGDEELPFDVSYFDLGLTSLRITEIKQRLETLFGRGINANLLFNSPTVDRLLSYLADELLADVLSDRAASPGPAGSAPAGSARVAGDALVNDVLRDLYQA